MALKIMETADGSSTFYNEELDETYHSRHGAIQEAEHVFLKMGLDVMMKEKENIDILEMGFGTGLNALLTAMRAKERGCEINYIAIEAYPLKAEELALVNYSDLIKDDKAKEFMESIHQSDWEKDTEVHSCFNLNKKELFFEELDFENCFDLIYFDAFGPQVQPDLWTENIFARMFKALRIGGLMTTYCAQGNARRAMIASGFEVKKVAGPPGKREMLIARKNG